MAEENKTWDRKYRPTNWEEYVGNDRIKERLALALEKQKLPQMIMLEGPLGTGKTTMARLLAKALMCEEPVNGLPCGHCKSCQILDKKFILNGGSVNNMPIYEYNMAQLKGVDDANKIVNQMKTSSIAQKKRIFILDEVQRLSTQAQATYLKPLEEPGEGLYVIVCTTDPQDLLTTFRSRLNSFKIKRPSVNDIAQRLAEICTAEGVNYTMGALKLIAVKSDRVIRDSIKNTERISIYGKIDTKAVNEEFGIISQDIYTDFLNTVKTGKTYEIFEQTARLVENDISIPDFINGLGNFLVTLINSKASVKIEEYDVATIKNYRKYLDNFTEEQIIGLLKLIKNYSDVKRNEPYYLYALAVEANDIFNLEDPKVNINPIAVDKNQIAITDKIMKQGTKVTPKKPDANTFKNIFSNAKKVDGSAIKLNGEETVNSKEDVEEPKLMDVVKDVEEVKEDSKPKTVKKAVRKRKED